MSPLAVVLMVVGILVLVGAINLIVWLPIVRRMRRMPDELVAELAASGERIVRGPERVSYSGSTQSRVKGLSIAALTERRLIIRKAIGKPVEVAVADIAGVRTDKWFLGSRTGGRTHVIVKTKAGDEYGMLVADPEAWLAALTPKAA
jgi:hypothetical protein